MAVIFRISILHLTKITSNRNQQRTKKFFLLISVINYNFSISIILLFGSEIPRSVRFAMDAMALRASELQQKVSIAMKDSSSLEIFKAKIK